MSKYLIWTSLKIGAILGTELVTIFVGKDKRKFVLHKQLICKSVSCFRGAFSASGFKESGSVTYPTSAEEFDYLVDLYIFTEKLGINKVAKKTIDAIISRYYHKELEMTRERVEKIWANISPTSPLRKLYVHALVENFCEFEIPDEKKDSPGFMTERDLVS